MQQLSDPDPEVRNHTEPFSMKSLIVKQAITEIEDIVIFYSSLNENY